MSVIKYNGVTMYDVLTEGIEYNVEYDKTGVDPIGVKIRAVYTSTVHQSGAGQSNDGFITGHGIAVAARPVALGADPVEESELGPGMRELQRHLVAPRRRFTHWIGGKKFMDIVPAATIYGPSGVRASKRTTVDVAHGPRPSVKVMRVLGRHSMRIQFTIEAVVPDCDIFGPGNPLGVLNFRFWVGEDIDGKNWRTSRIYQGSFRVGSKAINPHLIPRVPAFFPPVQGGFKRTSINVQEDPDGLGGSFRVADEEQHAMPPYPATNWDGDFTILSPQPGGAIAEAEVNVELEGPNNIPKPALTNLAFSIIDKKLHFTEGVTKKGLILMRARIRESLRDNKVWASAHVKFVGDANNPWGGFHMPMREFGFPVAIPGYNSRIAWPARPTATLTGLWTCILQDPCHVASFPQLVDLSAGQWGMRAGKPGEKQGQGGEHKPYRGRKIKDDMHPYMTYQTRSKTSVDSGQCHLPLGESKGDKGKATVSVVDLYQANATRAISLVAQRIGAWPQVADLEKKEWKANGVTHRLMDGAVEPEAPILSADGKTMLYTVRAHYLMGLDKPPKKSDGFRAGRIPFNTEADFPANLFVPPDFVLDQDDKESPL